MDSSWVVGLGLAASAGASLLLATSQWLGSSRGPSAALAGLMPSVKRLETTARSSALATRTSPGSWEGELARAIAAAETEPERVDLASEAVAELGSAWARRDRWAWSALRLQALSAVLMAAWAMAQGAREAATWALLVGLAVAIVVHLIGRSASAREREQRSRADEFVRALFPNVGESPPIRGSKGARRPGGRRRLDRSASPM